MCNWVIFKDIENGHLCGVYNTLKVGLHFVSLWSETRKRRQSKFSVLTSLTETREVATREVHWFILHLFDNKTADSCASYGNGCVCNNHVLHWGRLTEWFHTDINSLTDNLNQIKLIRIINYQYGAVWCNIVDSTLCF